MGASLLDFVRGLEPFHFWYLTVFALVGVFGGFSLAFGRLRRARILEDVPTARIRSAPQGYVELQGIGRVLDGPPIIAPLSQSRCTWWWYRVEKRTDRGNDRWKTLREAASDELFALEDDTGRCIVDPEHAEVFPMVTRRWYGDSPDPVTAAPARRRFRRGDYRFTEKRMHPGDPLYAIGGFRTHYPHDHRDTHAEIGQVLRQWKQDRQALLERFDANRDGEIDLEEWDAVRAAARRQVQRERRELDADPGTSVLSAPADGRPFLLGALPQPDLAARLRRQAAGGLALFVVAGLALAVLIAGRFG